ncbi:alanine racemase [Neorhodopirellula pilleata]|uniref:D-threonine aldolase n=1 Tax=Neorhodopirellula pilleata TaxID=2714738 RepID=A0A5C6A8G7_9BACT|nr:alanine racemase [Neorhodopirellula pilleata]TWT96302.1 D-threonine aldolase [Neorhodopirellula pilleata]
MSDRPWYEIDLPEQLMSPSILVYPDRIDENLCRMIALVGNVDQWRPHVKTHKLPQVVTMKRRLGITRFKAATIAEAEMTATAGGEDVLLAYPIVGPNIERLLNLIDAFPATKFSALVDDHETLRRIDEHAQRRGVRVSLMLDLDVGMHRTGFPLSASGTGFSSSASGTDFSSSASGTGSSSSAAGIDRALRFYESMIDRPGIHALGLHAYDGHIHESDPNTLRSTIEEAFAPLWQLRDRIVAAGHPSPKLVLAGTPTSRHLAEIGDVEVGAGTTVLWDAGQPRLSPDLDFTPAAVVVARVVSRPSTSDANRTGNGLLCLDLGHKAVASEMPAPRVAWLNLPDAVEVMHSEEHLVVQSPAAGSIPVGTLLYGLPTHICPTMALHQDVGVVRDRRVVERWNVVARDRRIRF